VRPGARNAHGKEIEIVLKAEAEGPAVECVTGDADGAAQSVLKIRLPDARPRVRKKIIVPGGAGSAARRIDQALILSIARARSWLRTLREGEYAATSEIALRFGLGDAHVRKLLRLGFLAPDIVEAVVEGRQPRSLTVKLLLRGIPLAWSDQRTAFGFNR
jgi:hypothetical protein